MNNIYISIDNDFSHNPGLRTHNITPGNSGEDFYFSLLNEKFYQAVNKKVKLVINLDGTAGYTPSFLDESFGRLVFDFGVKMVNENLEIISNDEKIWETTIRESVFKLWEKRRLEKQYPSISSDMTIKTWWHYSNNVFSKISKYGNK